MSPSMKRAPAQKKILVVDDEADMRIFVSTVAETSGYEALVAVSGEEALEKARTHLPDLVILDVMMPNVEDGIHTYHLFKTEPGLKHVPIIMLSAIARKTFFHYITMLNLAKGDEPSEPEGYMEKPPDATELIRLMESILRKNVSK